MKALLQVPSLRSTLADQRVHLQHPDATKVGSIFNYDLSMYIMLDRKIQR